MTSSRYTFFALLLAVHGSLQKSSPTSPTYRAAVVEVSPALYREDVTRTMNENTAMMENYIEQAAKNNVDIIVFPELVPTTVIHPPRPALSPWTTAIPAPSPNYAPCYSNDTSISNAFKRLACAAERHKIYVAINLTERKNCSGNDCPIDGIHYYITTAVFDRNGKIISRYRKFNVVDERDVYSVEKVPNNATFTTDFGVTFGHIVCSDLWFPKPWLDVARELNVTDFIFQTAWNVKLPFSSTLQVHSGWSYTEDINMLAAAYNVPIDGDSGSAIFAGRQGMLSAVMSLEEHSELLIADVPKKSKKAPRPSTLYRDSEGHVRLVAENEGYQIRDAIFRQNDAGSFKIRYHTLEDMNTKLIAKNGSVVEELSHNGLECHFEANITNLGPSETYRLIAFNGYSQDGPKNTIGTRICSIVQCANETLNSCGWIYNTSTIFQSAAVTAIYVDNKSTTMVPNSLQTNLFPLTNWVFDQHKQGEHVHTYMYLPKPTRHVITFGVWGRNYAMDNFF